MILGMFQFLLLNNLYTNNILHHNVFPNKYTQYILSFFLSILLYAAILYHYILKITILKN
jgi:hypothetical protein